MVAAGSALRVLGAGLHSFGFTVFFLPLSQDLNLDRTSTSLAFSLARAEGAIEGPIVGHLLNRYGPKPIMIAAVLLMGIGYLLLSQINSYTTFLIIYLGVISLAHAGGFMHAPMVAPQRHPQACTMTLRIGATRTPPSPKAALLIVIARARWRMNHVLISTIGACINPPAWAREITPR